MDGGDALDWFNALTGRLEIVLTEPAKPVAESLPGNLAAAPTARIASLALKLGVVDDPDDLDAEPRELTEAEWTRVVLRVPRVRIGNDVGVVEHVAPDGATFSARDLVRAIEETERRTRPRSEWLGGIDVHHVYFEGMDLDSDGAWFIGWGS